MDYTLTRRGKLACIIFLFQIIPATYNLPFLNIEKSVAKVKHSSNRSI